MDSFCITYPPRPFLNDSERQEVWDIVNKIDPHGPQICGNTGPSAYDKGDYWQGSWLIDDWFIETKACPDKETAINDCFWGVAHLFGLHHICNRTLIDWKGMESYCYERQKRWENCEKGDHRFGRALTGLECCGDCGKRKALDGPLAD